MRKKNRPQKKKPHSSSVLSADERALLDTLLADIQNVDPSTFRNRVFSSQFALDFIEKLPLESARTPGLLQIISETFQQKEVQKALRKVLFKLKQRGVSLPELEPSSAPAFRISRVSQDQPSAHVGPIDGTGTRPVLVVVPQTPQGIALGMGLINDEHGIVEFAFGRYSKKKAKEVETIFFAKVPSTVETSLAHATSLLEKAYSLKAGTGETPGDYLHLRPILLEQAPPLEKPAVYEHLPLERMSKEIVTESQIQKLLTHELLDGWFVEPEKLKPLIEEILHAEQSPILISEIQKAERIKQMKESTVAKLYPDAQRSVVKQRLEEMAYLFFKSGDETAARTSLACALSLEEKDSLWKVNPFLKALLEKSLALYFRGTKAPSKQSPSDPSPSRILLS